MVVAQRKTYAFIRHYRCRRVHDAQQYQGEAMGGGRRAARGRGAVRVPAYFVCPMGFLEEF